MSSASIASPILLMSALLSGLALLRADENLPVGASRDEFSSVTQPFFEEHCLRCHVVDEANGNLRLDQLDVDPAKSTNFERWREIVSRVDSGEMPPKGEPRPEAARVAASANNKPTRFPCFSTKPTILLGSCCTNCG